MTLLSVESGLREYGFVFDTVECRISADQNYNDYDVFIL